MYSFEDLKNAVDDIDFSEEKFENSGLVLFGAKMNGSFAYEKLYKKYDIKAFTDNNSELWNKKHEGLDIIPPEEIKKSITSPFIIITVTGHFSKEIKKQLSEMEIPHITYAEYILKTEFEKFESVYKMLDDEFSKVTFVNLLMSHLNSEMCREICVKDQYFALPEFSIPSNKDVFVDCGAYVGDSAEAFIINHAGVFRSLYLFEPAHKTYNALCIRRKRLLEEWALNENQIIAEKKAVSNQNGIIFFENNENDERANHVSDGISDNGESVEIVSIDKYFEDKADIPTFIKADVEGAETALINGASQIISKYNPKLAICVYHRFEDLIEIPLKLREINPEYKMSLRHHMFNFHESVLYCY